MRSAQCHRPARLAGNKCCSSVLTRAVMIALTVTTPRLDVDIVKVDPPAERAGGCPSLLSAVRRNEGAGRAKEGAVASTDR